MCLVLKVFMHSIKQTSLFIDFCICLGMNFGISGLMFWIVLGSYCSHFWAISAPEEPLGGPLSSWEPPGASWEPPRSLGESLLIPSWVDLWLICGHLWGISWFIWCPSWDQVGDMLCILSQPDPFQGSFLLYGGHLFRRGAQSPDLANLDQVEAFTKLKHF